jgi:ferredoxin
MPKVTAQGKTFECSVGDNLCEVLLNNDVELYNGNAKILNCKGVGACGACTVRVDGKVSKRSWIETSLFSYGRSSLGLSDPSFRRR